MYYLMNKDKAVLAFDKQTDGNISGNILFDEKEKLGNLPLGFKDINFWIESRKSSKHNKHLKAVMKDMGCDNNEGYVQMTHATSVNDTFWIKKETENVAWRDVSLYSNQFTEVVSKLAFEGGGLQAQIVSSTSPELSVEGSYRKCFRKENEIGQYGSDIFIYKRGGELGRGIEPYSEQMASEIAALISPENAVRYDICELHKKLASKCNLFTSENIGYAPYSLIQDINKINLDDVYKFFYNIGSEQTIREMLVIDALCFNQDRHAGNYGILFDTETLETKCMAKIFDFNISLFPFVSDEELKNIGDVLYNKIEPKLGDDFTHIGQIGLNDSIRDKVKAMRDFTFSFRGDDKVSPERVRVIETAVQKQAAAILSAEKTYTIDVFPSKQAEADKQEREAESYAKTQMLDFWDTIKQTFDENDIYQPSFCEEGDILLIIENIDNNYQIEFDFKKGDITPSHNGLKCSWQNLKSNDKPLYGIGKEIINELKTYMKEKGDKTFNQCFDNQDEEYDGYF